MPTRTAAATGKNRIKKILERRTATLGSHSPLFYDSPLEMESGSGVWLTTKDGTRYLDAYNNVPHVGHCNPRVVEAVRTQALKLNIHTRYLNDRVLEYAETLLAQFEPPLNKVFFTNSGSEANELALRISRQHSGATGVLVSDHSYHGNTTSLAEITTALTVKETFAPHARALTIPDLDHPGDLSETELTESALADADAAIRSLQDHGFGVSAFLFDPLFSTEGLPRIPAGYIEGVAQRVHAAGGLVIADEVQSGFGRTGTAMWGHELFGVRPDLITLGKPMGNGHPLGGVVTTDALLEEFGSANLYFNTFAGNPVSAAAGMEVLKIMQEDSLQAHAAATGRDLRNELDHLAETSPIAGAAKGSGLFCGLEIVDGDGNPSAAVAKQVVERMKQHGVLISKVGHRENVLKIRPPMVFDRSHVAELIAALTTSLSDVAAALPSTEQR